MRVVAKHKNTAKRPLRFDCDRLAMLMAKVVLLLLLYLHIPEAIVFIVMGIIGGGIGLLSFRISQGSFGNLEQAFAREFTLFFLAPIISAESYGLKCRQFFSNIIFPTTFVVATFEATWTL